MRGIRRQPYTANITSHDLVPRPSPLGRNHHAGNTTKNGVFLAW